VWLEIGEPVSRGVDRLAFFWARQPRLFERALSEVLMRFLEKECAACPCASGSEDFPRRPAGFRCFELHDGLYITQRTVNLKAASRGMSHAHRGKSSCGDEESACAQWPRRSFSSNRDSRRENIRSSRTDIRRVCRPCVSVAGKSASDRQHD